MTQQKLLGWSLKLRVRDIIDFAGARYGGGREEGAPVPLSDEAGVWACQAFVSRLCMGAGTWAIKWGDISAVVCVPWKMHS